MPIEKKCLQGVLAYGAGCFILYVDLIFVFIFFLHARHQREKKTSALYFSENCVSMKIY